MEVVYIAIVIGVALATGFVLGHVHLKWLLKNEKRQQHKIREHIANMIVVEVPDSLKESLGNKLVFDRRELS